MSINLKNDLIKGSFWSVLGQFFTLLISFIANIILARILSPNEFGQIGIIMFFVTIISVISQSGLGGALVRNKDATDIDYSTAFVTNLAFSIILYLLIVILSQPISYYYHDANLKELLIVSSIIVLINAFQISQNARLISNLKFKQQYIFRFSATLLASTIGVILAYSGYGVWSLVVLQLCNALFYTLLLWWYQGTALSFRFSKEAFHKMKSFGMYTTLSSILTSIFDNVYQLILAKYFSIAQTGNYYQAKRFQDVPGGVLNVLMQGVIFSSLSKLQDDKKKFIVVYNTISKYFTIILGVISLVLFAYAEPIILLIFGLKWIGAVYFMKMLTIASFFYMQENFNRIIFKVYDRTKYIFTLDIFKKIIQSVGIIIGLVTKSLDILIIGFVISSAIGYFVNFYVSRKILENLNIKELIMQFSVIASIGVAFFIISTALSLIQLSLYAKLGTIPLSLIIYLLILYLFKIINIKEIKNIRKLK